MTTVSVLIPTYNCATRLVQALMSVAAQTLPHERIELLVIDDGSTDETGDRVREFSVLADFPVRYLRQDNAGPAAARNHGLRKATGSLIAFLDDDDSWLPTKLQRQVELFYNNVGLVYCDNVFVDSDGHALKNYTRNIKLVRGDALLTLFENFFLLTSSVCVTREIIDKVGFFNENLSVGEDYEFFLRIASHTKFDFVPEKLLIRTVRPDSLSRRDYALDFYSDLNTITSYLEHNPEFAKRNRVVVRKRIADYRFEFGYHLLNDNRRKEACQQLIQSLRARPSLRAAKTFIRLLSRVRGRARQTP